MDPDILRIAQIVAVFVIGLSFLTVVTHAVKAAYLRSRRKTELSGVGMSVDDSRFERLERAVDAIALEVERMSEAQRFTAKLMTERPAERIPAPASASKEPKS
jgi:hypothetical protein